MSDEQAQGEIKIDSIDEPRQWVAKWGVYGPFESTKWRTKGQTYWRWQVDFFQPDGSRVRWYGCDIFDRNDYLDGNESTRAEAIAVAVETASTKLEYLRRKAEPVESGVVTLPSTVK